MAITYSLESVNSDVTTYIGLRYFSDDNLRKSASFVSPDGKTASADYSNILGDPAHPTTLHFRINHETDKKGTSISRYSFRLRTWIIGEDDDHLLADTFTPVDCVIAWNVPSEMRNTSVCIQDLIQMTFTALMDRDLQGTAGSATDAGIRSLTPLLFNVPDAFTIEA
jgi:hypothetical protein